MKHYEMPPEIAALEACQHVHNQIAVKALRSIANDAGAPYPVVRDTFIGGHYETTLLFWEKIKADHGGRFVGVDWCHGCRKFSLEEADHGADSQKA